MNFYVIDDLNKKNFSIDYFERVSEAYEAFQGALPVQGAMPALGVRLVGAGDKEQDTGAIDLLHGVGGETVLVPDYRHIEKGAYGESMMEVLGDIVESVRWLVEAGGVSYEFQNGLIPPTMQGDFKALVPVTLGGEPADSYCEDKTLKTTVRNGLDAIDSMYIEMHGWVAYDEFLRHPKEYAPEGYFKVSQLYVCYVKESNIVGIDGRMDIAPHEFKRMVEEIRKPFGLVVYDNHMYEHQFKGKHEFLVASYDSLSEAVKGWYEVQERAEACPRLGAKVPLVVRDMDEPRKSVLFNGADLSGNALSREKAAKVYGFQPQSGLNDVLASAAKTAREHNAELFGEKPPQEREM